MMGRSSMSKQMMREGGKVKPRKKESEDSKQARANSKALVGNLNLTEREKALKEVKDRAAKEKETKKNNKESGKVKPKKKKLTAAQITAIRNKPVSQRTMAEVRMIVPNAVNKLGHTQAQADRYAAGAAQVNKMRAAGMGLRKLPDLTEREKALKKVKDSSKSKKDAAAKKKKATGDAVYEKYVNQYQREEDRTGFDKKVDTFFDKVGDKVRGSAVGKYAKSKGTGTFSRDDEAQMQARKDIKGYKKGGKIRGAGIAKKGIRKCKMR